MTKMLVTQALDERDLLVKKIDDKIGKARFVDTIQRNEELVMDARVPRKEFEKQAKASLQQIMDLINRYQKIDAAIITSNAKTMIQTSVGKLSVAGAIALRARIQSMGSYAEEGDFENNLSNQMEQEYNLRVKYADAKNQKLQETAEQMRLSILGRDSKTKDDKPLDVVDAYIKENTTELVDPIGVKEKADEIRLKRDDLLTELNTQIKVSNATTFVEI